LEGTHSSIGWKDFYLNAFFHEDFNPNFFDTQKGPKCFKTPFEHEKKKIEKPGIKDFCRLVIIHVMLSASYLIDNKDHHLGRYCWLN
jgi:hypothetical protein